ncbi:hypothetical protein [Brevibacterium yomogidense]|uniref:hypothetical protein n=1 Tax=Brevibacterium yomogidense TaxID=946573 RepID=UPI001E32B1DE|nr:hypothetical protein [Brevibacterium yomogidense]
MTPSHPTAHPDAQSLRATPRSARIFGSLAAITAVALLAGCGQPASPGSTASGSHAEGAPAVDPSDRETHEAAGANPRLAVTYDGGVLVVDALTGDPLADLPANGFTRLNQAGDDRHLFLTEGDSFRLLDTGTWSEPHGDHSHSYTTDPVLSDQRVEGSHPGHLVVHDGIAAAFFDGDGAVKTFDPTALDASTPISTDDQALPDPHHGVAVPREDGSVVLTEGTEESRSTVLLQDADGEEIARTDDCPGVHGEAVAADGVITLGCENGIVVVDGDTIEHIDAAQDYARIGNQAGSEESPVVLGDYKTDPDAEQEHPTQVSLTDTDSGEIRIVDLPASYSFCSLARGPEGEALVFGTDGTLRVIDPDSGDTAAEVPVTDAWEEPAEWQTPMPNLTVSDDLAFITDPETRTVSIVDLTKTEDGAEAVVTTYELPQVPNEISVASGAVSEATHEHGDGATLDH